MQRGHIAPAPRAGTIQAGREERGRKSPAWSQHGGSMDHKEQAGVKSHKNHEPMCVCECVCGVRKSEKKRELAA